MWIIYLTFLILFELIADIFSKEYALHGTMLRWLGAIVGYIIANVFWLFAIKNGSGLARGAIIFSIASAIIAVGLGLLLYKETPSKTQIFGITLGILSLILIFWK